MIKWAVFFTYPLCKREIVLDLGLLPLIPESHQVHVCWPPIGTASCLVLVVAHWVGNNHGAVGCTNRIKVDVTWGQTEYQHYRSRAKNFHIRYQSRNWWCLGGCLLYRREEDTRWPGVSLYRVGILLLESLLIRKTVCCSQFRGGVYIIYPPRTCDGFVVTNQPLRTDTNKHPGSASPFVLTGDECDVLSWPYKIVNCVYVCWFDPENGFLMDDFVCFQLSYPALRSTDHLLLWLRRCYCCCYCCRSLWPSWLQLPAVRRFPAIFWQLTHRRSFV